LDAVPRETRDDPICTFLLRRNKPLNKLIFMREKRRGAAHFGSAFLTSEASGFRSTGQGLAFRRDLGVRFPDEAPDDLHTRGYVRVRPAQIVQLLQGINVHSDGNNVFHSGFHSGCSSSC
jgi:hypothetical protein